MEDLSEFFSILEITIRHVARLGSVTEMAEFNRPPWQSPQIRQS